MLKTFRLIGLAVAALAAAAEPSFAQMAEPTMRSGRPSRGLFGGGVGDVQQSLALVFSLGGGYDWDLSAPPTVPPGSPPPPAPFYTGPNAMASGGLQYGVSKDRISGSANLNGGARYNPRNGGVRFGSVGLGASFNVQLSTRSSINFSQSVSLQPPNLQLLYGNSLEAGAVPSTAMDLSGATTRASRFHSNSSVGYTHGLTSRISFVARYAHRIFNAFDGDPTTGSKEHTGTAGLSFQIARGVSFRAGYGQTVAQFGTNAPVTYGGGTFDGGLSYGRSLSLTRQTSLSFGSGLVGLRDTHGASRYVVTGRLSLSYEIGRSWTAAANIRRNVDFSLGFNQPMVVGGASFGISGGVGRRFQLTTQSGMSRGTVGIGAGAPDFTVVTAGAGLSTAISRNFAVTSSYGFRYYRFDDPASLPFGLRPETQRHTVRVSLDVWVPLFTRARSADATR